MASIQLTDAELRRLARRLQVERTELDAELIRLAGTLQQVQISRADGTADDEHDPEGPTMSSEWSRVSGVHGELVAKSEAVRRALVRLADGCYGDCLHCGTPIGTARLEARPAAELCIHCARAAETHR